MKGDRASARRCLVYCDVSSILADYCFFRCDTLPGDQKELDDYNGGARGGKGGGWTG
jgi:hypothetical protein